jgi:hypothetical protein
MTNIRLAACVAALVLAPAALTACGGGGNSQDEDEITAAINKAATSGDPAACTEVQTANFTRQTSGSVESCKKDAANTAADTADVTNIDVSGDSATAEAAFTGSILNGQSVNLALVKEGDTWKLDQVKGFATFNRDAFVASFDKELTSGSNPAPPQVAACVKQQFDNATDAQLQAVILTQNGGDQLFAPCSKQ